MPTYEMSVLLTELSAVMGGPTCIATDATSRDATSHDTTSTDATTRSVATGSAAAPARTKETQN
eukprot:1169539-Amphidinium_carterae.1